MPMALSPDRTVAITLRTDEGRPGAPTFHVRFPTPRRARQMRELIQRADAAANAWIDAPRDTEELANAVYDLRESGRDEARKLLLDAIRLVLASWSDLKDEDGQTVVYAPDSVGILGELLHVLELADLANRALNETQLRAYDFFYSASPSGSPRANGAGGEDGAPAPANESTPPTDPSR